MLFFLNKGFNLDKDLEKDLDIFLNNRLSM